MCAGQRVTLGPSVQIVIAAHTGAHTPVLCLAEWCMNIPLAAQLMFD